MDLDKVMQAMAMKAAEYFVLMWRARAIMEERPEEADLPYDRMEELGHAAFHNITEVLNSGGIKDIEEFYDCLEKVWMEQEASKGKDW